MSTPAVSVIIPTYNRAEFVIQAVESVFKQTFADFELILVDDGSSDETRAALEPYSDCITYLYQSNRGVSSARNLGLKIAQGKWLAFLDSDDLWLPEKLEGQMG
ncbi:MAG: glycosyltransferase family A protein, partial [Thermodesulfobacteriota bacterium]